MLIRDAQKLNNNAANALLKTLEDPPQKTFILLCSETLGAIMPTIRSRCQIFRDCEKFQDNESQWYEPTYDFIKFALNGVDQSPKIIDKINKSSTALHNFERQLLSILHERFKSLDNAKHQEKISTVWEAVHRFYLMSQNTHLDISHKIAAYNKIIYNPLYRLGFDTI